MRISTILGTLIFLAGTGAAAADQERRTEVELSCETNLVFVQHVFATHIEGQEFDQSWSGVQKEQTTANDLNILAVLAPTDGSGSLKSMCTGSIWHLTLYSATSADTWARDFAILPARVRHLAYAETTQ